MEENLGLAEPHPLGFSDLKGSTQPLRTGLLVSHTRHCAVHRVTKSDTALLSTDEETSLGEARGLSQGMNDTARVTQV